MYCYSVITNYGQAFGEALCQASLVKSGPSSPRFGPRPVSDDSGTKCCRPRLGEIIALSRLPSLKETCQCLLVVSQVHACLASIYSMPLPWQPSRSTLMRTQSEPYSMFPPSSSVGTVTWPPRGNAAICRHVFPSRAHLACSLPSVSGLATLFLAQRPSHAPFAIAPLVNSPSLILVCR